MNNQPNPNEEEPKIAIIINSCKKYYSTTIKHVIKTAEEAEIPKENIYVVVGEMTDNDLIEQGLTDVKKIVNEKDKYIIVNTPTHTVIYCKFVNTDYNGVIFFTQTERGLIELQKYTHFFYLHDTCCFLPTFWKNIINYSYFCDMYVKLQNYTAKTIGLINVRWFVENKKEMLKYFINYDIEKVLLYKDGSFPNETLIRRIFGNLPLHLNEDAIFFFTDDYVPIGDYFQNDCLHEEFNYIYSNELRLILRYENPGIIKHQKNWGHTPNKWNITL